MVDRGDGDRPEHPGPRRPHQDPPAHPPRRPGRRPGQRGHPPRRARRRRRPAERLRPRPAGLAGRLRLRPAPGRRAGLPGLRPAPRRPAQRRPRARMPPDACHRAVDRMEAFDAVVHLHLTMTPPRGPAGPVGGVHRRPHHRDVRAVHRGARARRLTRQRPGDQSRGAAAARQTGGDPTRWYARMRPDGPTRPGTPSTWATPPRPRLFPRPSCSSAATANACLPGVAPSGRR